MEQTATQVYSWIQIGSVALVSVLALVSLVVQTRSRAYSRVGAAVRAAFGVAVFGLLLVWSGVALNWAWGAVFALVGAGAGYASGRASRITRESRGARPRIRPAPWPALVVAVSYMALAGAIAFGGVGLVSVSLLVVLLGAAMGAGAVVAEARKAAPGTSSPDAAEEAAATAAPE